MTYCTGKPGIPV